MKKIIIIHTGGTISMEEAPAGTVGLTKEHPFSQLTFQATEDVEVHMEQIYMLPSPHISPNHMFLLMNLIKAKEKEGYDGIVVTHGTDTLEETAYFLDITTNPSIPIVITGAMRSSNEVGSDALYNILTSVRVAADNGAKEMGVLVVMNDEIHSAKGVTKTHTSNVATFQSPQFGPIGIATKHEILFFRKIIEHEYYEIKELQNNVVLLKAYTGMDETLFEALYHRNIHGMVIEAFGQGNVPPEIVDSIQKLIDKGLPVVLVSRCFNGFVQGLYDYEGGGKQLLDIGVIFSNGINGQKARLKLSVLIAAGIQNDQLKNYF